MKSVSNLLNSLGLLILRVGFGCYMLSHGIPKVMKFGELSTTFPDPIGVGSSLSLILAIAAEVGCSLLLIIGLGTRLAAVPLAATMFVALLIVHAADPWQKKELAAVYLTVYASLLFTGGGAMSLDQVLWRRRQAAKARKAD